MIPTPNQIITAILIFIGAYIAAVVVMFLLRRSNIVTRRTETKLDEVIVRSISKPIHIIFLTAGVILAMRYLYPDLQYQNYGYKALSIVVFGILGTYTFNRVVRSVIGWYESNRTADGGTHRGLFGFMESLISVAVWGLVFLLFLKFFGVDVSAMLAGFGIAGVAVAFALQNTLSGLFSTLYLAVDKPVRPGDFIELDEGTSGFVEDVSMRSTRIRTRANNIVIVPNTKLANMIITNYYLPERAMRARIRFGVAYDSDLDHVEQVTKDVARAVIDEYMEGTDEEPAIRFTSFEDSAINVIIVVKVAYYDNQYEFTHELIKTLKKRFAKEGIVMPFPQQDVHIINDHKGE